MATIREQYRTLVSYVMEILSTIFFFAAAVGREDGRRRRTQSPLWRDLILEIESLLLLALTFERIYTIFLAAVTFRA